jgi:ATP-dependent Lon protease
MRDRTKDPGVAVGLAWTPVGGDVLFVEASRMPGASHLTITGQLGDVMKESARIALSWFRASASRYGVDPAFYKDAEIHLHVPAGAIPKDGPSAGVTMVTALLRRCRDGRCRPNLAMTGEINCPAGVLPVGGFKEKVLAARRMGLRELILPRQNERNIVEDLTPAERRTSSSTTWTTGRSAESGAWPPRSANPWSGRGSMSHAHGSISPEMPEGRGWVLRPAPTPANYR